MPKERKAKTTSAVISTCNKKLQNCDNHFRKYCFLLKLCLLFDESNLKLKKMFSTIDSGYVVSSYKAVCVNF